MAIEILSETHDFTIQGAKKKGCSAQIAFADSDEVVNVFMGGIGAAMFSTQAENQPASLDDVLRRDTVSMEWVFNRFFGRHDKFGEINVTFKVAQQDQLRSGMVLVSNSMENQIFPATSVNTLFFELNLVDSGIVLFNKDPLLLRSDSTNADAEHVRSSPQYLQDPEALPKSIQELVDGRTQHFTPVGVYRLKQPVPLYSKSAPDTVVATMREAEVNVGVHHGLELTVLETRADKETMTARIELRNLSRSDHDIRWCVGDLNNLEVLSEREGAVKLQSRMTMEADADRTILTVRARKRDPARPTTRVDCVFVGACNIAPRYADLICAFITLTPQPDGRIPAEAAPRLVTQKASRSRGAKKAGSRKASKTAKGRKR